MYTCPECGAHNVRIARLVPIIEYWNGDDVENEEDLTYDRTPDEGTIECLECGNEDSGSFVEEWYDDGE